jgi:glucosamine--fructose-6-phosphate aminotransferase (isomerizing)
MCGIVGFTGNKHALNFLLEGLSRLEYRGYDSCGIAVLNNQEIQIVKTVDRISDLIKKTEKRNDLIGTVGIGHTRWATHGEPSRTNAHPHVNSEYRFAVVHNGIIENYAEIRNELKQEGVQFMSETDTEVIPHLIDKYYADDLLEAVSSAVKRLKGSYALGIICTDYPDTVIAVRKFSPLIIGLSKDANYIASDVTALVSHTRNIIYMEDGDIACITPTSVKMYDIDGKSVERPVYEITWDIEAAEKCGYEHFMLKEIFEQPAAIAQTIKSRIVNNDIVFENICLDENKLKNFNKIMITACGSAYHAGVVGKYVFEKAIRIPTEVDLASEFRYRNPLIDDKTLTIVISQSGETADTLAALHEAKSRGSHVLSIVNVVGSSIARASDDVIYTWAGPEIAVATTKGYTTQLAVLYMFALWAAKRLGTISDDEAENIINSLCELPDAVEKTLENVNIIKQMAKHCCDTQSLFFIGRNIDYAVALEASLKLKEISYIHSEAYAGGELKHGTISLIEDGRTVIALACHDELYEKILSNIKEVKARGAYVVACTFEGNHSIADNADDVIYIPKVHPMLSASVEIVPFQLYAYYVALYKGCDIDKPRNLAKSVTVE